MTETLDTPFLVTRLDLEKPITIVGADVQAIADEILAFMEISSMPVDLVGAPGTGKSHVGAYVTTEWARRHGVNAYTAIHDTDTTKSSAIAGFRMHAGSSIVIPGTVATAMGEDSACFIDEFTHARQNVQGGYNTISDRQHRTTAGNMTFEGGNRFRLVLAHNTAQFAGNESLMPSFASRLAVWQFGFPSVKTEAQIARDIAMSEVARHRLTDPTIHIPNAVVCYLTSVMRHFRAKAPMLGLSARNVATALLLLETKAKKEGITNQNIDRHFATDAVKRQVAERVLWRPTAEITSADLKNETVMLAMRFITSVGVEKFREAILQSFMYYLDVKGATVRSDKALREEMHKEAV